MYIDGSSQHQNETAKVVVSETPVKKDTNLVVEGKRADLTEDLIQPTDIVSNFDELKKEENTTDLYNKVSQFLKNGGKLKFAFKYQEKGNDIAMYHDAKISKYNNNNGCCLHGGFSGEIDISEKIIRAKYDEVSQTLFFYNYEEQID